MLNASWHMRPSGWVFPNGTTSCLLDESEVRQPTLHVRPYESYVSLFRGFPSNESVRSQLGLLMDVFCMASGDQYLSQQAAHIPDMDHDATIHLCT